MKLMDRIRNRHRPGNDEPVTEEARKQEERQKALEAQKQLENTVMRDQPLV